MKPGNHFFTREKLIGFHARGYIDQDNGGGRAKAMGVLFSVTEYIGNRSIITANIE